MGAFSIWHILILAVVVFLLFGRGKISDLMGDVAKGIKNFREGMKDEPEPPRTISRSAAPPNRPRPKRRPSTSRKADPMFDIGWSELLIVLVVALVVVGPKDLPRLMRMVGRWVGKARRMADQFKSSFDEMARESRARRAAQGNRRAAPQQSADRGAGRAQPRHPAAGRRAGRPAEPIPAAAGCGRDRSRTDRARAVDR